MTDEILAERLARVMDQLRRGEGADELILYVAMHDVVSASRDGNPPNVNDCQGILDILASWRTCGRCKHACTSTEVVVLDEGQALCDHEGSLLHGSVVDLDEDTCGQWEERKP